MPEEIPSNLVYPSVTDDKSEISPPVAPEQSTLTTSDEMPNPSLVMQKQLNRYFNMTEQAPAGIFQFDPTGELQYVNQEWETLTGVSLDKSIESGWFSVIHPEDKERIKEDWNKSIWGGEEFDSRCRLATGEDCEKWVCIHIRPELSGSGEILSYIGVLTDIGNFYAGEIPIDQPKGQAKPELLTGQFALGLSRSLENALQAMISYLQLLEKAVTDKLSAVEFSHIASAMEEGEKIQTLLDSLKEYVEVGEN